MSKTNLSKSYYIRKRKINKAYLLVVVICVILSSVIFIGAAQSSLPKSDFMYKTQIEFWFLYIKNFDDAVSASNFAKVAKGRGAAGYVVKDDKFYVCAAAYFEPIKAQQILLIMKQSEPQAALSQKIVIAINHGVVTKQTKDKIINATLQFKQILHELYTISAKLEKQEITTTVAKSQITKLQQSNTLLFETLASDKNFASNNLNNFRQTIFNTSMQLSSAIIQETTPENLRYLIIDICQQLRNLN